MILHHGCFHIRKSADRSLFAAPRSLSQLVTSFIGSWCQGIHLTLLFAWTSVLQHLVLDLNCLSFFLNISFRDYIVRIEKVSLSFVHFFHLSVKLFFYPLLLERPIISYLSSISVRFYSNLHIQNVCDLSLIRLSKIIAKPAGSAGRSGWTRTIDLTLIRRAL